jgi:hypothetical protein
MNLSLYILLISYVGKTIGSYKQKIQACKKAESKIVTFSPTCRFGSFNDKWCKPNNFTESLTDPTQAINPETRDRPAEFSNPKLQEIPSLMTGYQGLHFPLQVNRNPKLVEAHTKNGHERKKPEEKNPFEQFPNNKKDFDQNSSYDVEQEYDADTHHDSEQSSPYDDEYDDSHPDESLDENPPYNDEYDDSQPDESLDENPPYDDEYDDSHPDESLDENPPYNDEYDDSHPDESLDENPPYNDEYDDSHPDEMSEIN